PLGDLRLGDANQQRPDLPSDRLGVVMGQRGVVSGHALLAAPRRLDDDQVLADALQPLVQFGPRPLAGGHQGNDGGDADDDAQARQERTPLVEEQGVQGDAQRGEQAHRVTSSAGRRLTTSLASWPSLTVTRRAAYAAMAGSCVTRRIVCPW